MDIFGQQARARTKTTALVLHFVLPATTNPKARPLAWPFRARSARVGVPLQVDVAVVEMATGAHYVLSLRPSRSSTFVILLLSLESGPAR